MDRNKSVTCCAVFVAIVVALTAIAAVAWPIFHGLHDVSGLDGERNYGDVLDPVTGETISSSSHTCLGNETLSTDGHENTCPPIINGEFFTTLSIWLFVWGISTLVVLLLAAIAYCLRRNGTGAGVAEGLAGLIAFFAWVPWGIIGLVILVRRRYNIDNVWTDDAIYITSIIAIIIVFFVWFAGTAAASFGIGTSDRGVVLLWRAMKQSGVSGNVDAKTTEELDEGEALLLGAENRTVDAGAPYKYRK